MSVKLHINPLIERLNEQTINEEANNRREDEKAIGQFESLTGRKVSLNQAQAYHEIANIQRDIKVIEQFESSAGQKARPDQVQTYLRINALLRNAPHCKEKLF